MFVLCSMANRKKKVEFFRMFFYLCILTYTVFINLYIAYLYIITIYTIHCMLQ